jgi:hypothetical protein
MLKEDTMFESLLEYAEPFRKIKPRSAQVIRDCEQSGADTPGVRKRLSAGLTNFLSGCGTKLRAAKIGSRMSLGGVAR